jgi:hypothetical protein
MKINLGCGQDIREGYLNVDKVSGEGITVHDINEGHIRLGEDVTEVYAHSVLEHLECQGIVNIHKTLCEGGILWGDVPHFLSRWAYSDYTHTHYFCEQTFQQYPFSLFRVERLRTWYCFTNGIKFWLPAWMVYLHVRILPGVLPPSHIEFKLRKR